VDALGTEPNGIKRNCKKEKQP